ncbi:MAG: hypothetical protein Q9169_006165, partial [Polycauliona sp. 2 TL-2023]
DNPRVESNLVTVTGILGLTAIVLFFAYMCYRQRTVAGRLTVQVSITTGLPSTTEVSVLNENGRQGPAPNSNTSHTGSNQGPISNAGTDTSGAHSNVPQDLASTQAGPPPVTRSSSSNNGIPGTLGSLPPTQNPTQQEASHVDPASGHTGVTNIVAVPPLDPSTSRTHGSQNIYHGVNYYGPGDPIVQVPLGYSPRLFGAASLP